MKKVRIILADDHRLFREGIRKLLESSKEIEIAAEASSGKELLEAYNNTEHDIIVTDISMPEGTGTEVIEQISAKNSEVKVLFLSMHTSDEYLYYAIKSGGQGFVSKGITQKDLIDVIKRIYQGENYFLGLTTEECESIIKKYDLKNERRASLSSDSLTQREKEVVNLIAEGRTSIEIAEQLFLSKRTIDNHRSSIMSKLDLRSLPELLKFAIELKYNHE